MAKKDHNHSVEAEGSVEIESSPANEDGDPGIVSVRDYLVYGLSLPERTLRSTAAMVGGVLNESSELLVPQAFRDSKSYQTFVQQMLDMVARDVGGVGTDSQDNVNNQQQVENYVARKTVGSFIDLAGMATLHVSPIVILAVVSDLAYGSKTYLNELGEQLKKEGVIAEESTINGASDLLDAISQASGGAASAFDTPPVSIEGLKKTIDETTEIISRIDPTTVIPKSEIDRLWSDMQNIAEREHVGMIEISSALTMYTLNQVGTVTKGALTTISVTGQMLDRHVLQHYANGLSEISERGVYTILAESSQPYIEAVWQNFSTGRSTVTEDLISGKLVGKVWSGMRGWLNKDPDDV